MHLRHGFIPIVIHGAAEFAYVLVMVNAANIFIKVDEYKFNYTYTSTWSSKHRIISSFHLQYVTLLFSTTIR